MGCFHSVAQFHILPLISSPIRQICACLCAACKRGTLLLNNVRLNYSFTDSLLSLPPLERPLAERRKLKTRIRCVKQVFSSLSFFISLTLTIIQSHQRPSCSTCSTLPTIRHKDKMIDVRFRTAVPSPCCVNDT